MNPFAKRDSCGYYSFMFGSGSSTADVPAIGVSDDGVYQEMRLLFDSLEVPIRKIAAQLLLELSKQEESRELIISDGCVPFIINRTNDVHCGEDSALIFLELAHSPQLAATLMESQTFAALQNSLRDADTLHWQPTLCMALTNCFASGAKSVRELVTRGDHSVLVAMLSSLLYSLTEDRGLSWTEMSSKRVDDIASSKSLHLQWESSSGADKPSLLLEALPKVKYDPPTGCRHCGVSASFPPLSYLLYSLANYFAACGGAAEPTTHEAKSDCSTDLPDVVAEGLLNALSSAHTAALMLPPGPTALSQKIIALTGIVGTLYNLLLSSIDNCDSSLTLTTIRHSAAVSLACTCARDLLASLRLCISPSCTSPLQAVRQLCVDAMDVCGRTLSRIPHPVSALESSKIVSADREARKQLAQCVVHREDVSQIHMQQTERGWNLPVLMQFASRQSPIESIRVEQEYLDEGGVWSILNGTPNTDLEFVIAEPKTHA